MNNEDETEAPRHGDDVLEGVDLDADESQADYDAEETNAKEVSE